MSSHDQRMAIHETAPEAYKAVYPLQKYATSGTLDKSLMAMVDIRASQINKCAWCLDMHTVEARDAGVPQRTIDLISAWEEAGTLFTEREQAALALTEQVTLISRHGVTDDVWELVSEAFDEDEVVHLLMVIAVINVWNRMNVTVRTELKQQDA